MPNRPTVLMPLLLAVSCAWSQSESMPQPEAVFRTNVRLVVVDAQVLNRKTRQNVIGLTPGDFRLFENGIRQPISYLSQDELPLSVVFLFDLTDSVHPVLKPLAAGALQALRHLKPEDEAAVMVYAVSTQLLQGFTTDHHRIEAAIERASRLESPEAAFFNEGLFQAASQAAQAANGRRRIVIWLTDNIPNLPSEELQYKYHKSIPISGLHSEAEALEELFRDGVVVYTLLLRSDISEREFMHNLNDPMHRLGRRRYPPGDVYRYTEQTGGQVLESWSPSRAGARLADLIDQIRTRYALGYHPPADAATGRFHELKLEIAPEIRLREGKLIVNVRKGYYR
ncbi:MAG TPA: VWA domain-containing protein [Candidatus Saccharimonadales bacterium]|jgi:VWFA-related protein|nr:VWA domain-containing protein [Candidatus Saccharimonadales bacterium]